MPSWHWLVRKTPEEARRSKGRVAAERAANTKDYLVTDKGIDASRIVLYTGTTDSADGHNDPGSVGRNAGLPPD